MSYFYDSELDRKSSRGMIYENEELRLRTININAEVERGQSDIKRLRRENEHLRREIWTLRDECDRLNKRFKARLLEHEHGGGCSARGSAGSCGARHSVQCDAAHSNCNSDDSDSCDSCKGNDDQCSDECCAGGSCTQLAAKQSLPGTPTGNESRMTMSGGGNVPQALHNAFDHLSVVSEETLSNSELQAPTHSDQLLGYAPDSNGSQMTLPSVVGPLTPLTPIEQVANQLNDLQAMVPPLSYFENVLQQHMGSNIGNSPLSSSTGNVVRHTNGWDYNLQSPFAHRKYHSSSSPSPPKITRSPLTQQRFTPAQPPALSTFAPSMSVELSPEAAPSATGYSPTDAPSSTIETVAITTMPTNAPPLLNSPKHFFAPLKPRLKINTMLANKATATTTAAAATTTTAPSAQLQNCDPPDIYVANALASPYQRHQMLPSAVPPPLPQRGSSSQVSARHRPRAQQQQRHQQEQQQQHRHQHQQPHHQQLHQQQPQLQQLQLAALAAAETDGDDAVAAAAVAAANVAFVAKPINSNTHPPVAIMAAAPTALAANPNTLLTKLNEPIYATAQKGSKLISAPAVTQPLMVAAIASASDARGATTATAHRATPSPTPSSKSTAMKATTTTITVDSESQTDSVNLEAILNDIETISEDILAIQMEKKKLHDHQNGTDINKPLQEGDKNRKPYRSEMNLMLQYDGTNSTITPARAAIATQTPASVGGDSSSNGRCTRSLEREHTDTPSPHLPDPMTPFPDKCTYIGFDQLNSAASGRGGVNAQKPPLPPGPASTPSGAGTPTKPPPPTPPARIFPSALNIRCAGVARATPVSPPQAPPTVDEQAMQTAPVPGLAPNKSHLYAVVANAAAKRSQFEAAPLQLNRLPETDVSAGPENELEDSMAKRKARRVSIICGETSAPATPDHAPNQSLHRSQAQIANTNSNTNTSSNNIVTSAQSNSTTTTNVTTTAHPTTHSATGSCIDLPSVLANPALKSLKQASHSTPSTPHSARRRSNSISQNAAELTTQSAHCSPQHHQGHYQQQQQPLHHANSSCSNLIAAQQRKSSQDSTRDLAAAAAIVARSKCSRRHSDGTVASTAQRVSSTSNSALAGPPHHHHHHHHHQHQHRASVVSNSAHHNHHAHQDSNHETGTSASERNSNSLASSRESSTSFSVRSHRRKISVSSHTGGKIPWCGCWGNGCL